MKIIFCYSGEPDLESFRAITKFAPQAELVDTSGSIYDYNEAIASRWTGESDLVVIEGDKEITAEVIPSFNDCDEPWCTFKYKNLPGHLRMVVTIGLGCAKFSAELQREVGISEFICPDVPWQPCRHCGNKGCWNQLDARMARAFGNHDIDFPHVHGHVKHHHVYDDKWWHGFYEAQEYAMDTSARMAEIEAWQNEVRNSQRV